jgi:hypothetical protein
LFYSVPKRRKTPTIAVNNKIQIKQSNFVRLASSLALRKTLQVGFGFRAINEPTTKENFGSKSKTLQIKVVKLQWKTSFGRRATLQDLIR